MDFDNLHIAMKMTIENPNQSESLCFREDRAPVMAIAGSDFFMGDCQMPTTHKLSRINGKRRKLYLVWTNMKYRCQNPNHSRFKYYGEMGVVVCDEWLDYKIFHDWAMANGYKEGLTIDRINPNGHYEPSNCRWIKMGLQTLNHRTKKGQGLYWCEKRKTWRARYMIKGKETCKYFKTYNEAEAYLIKERQRAFSEEMNIKLGGKR